MEVDPIGVLARIIKRWKRITSSLRSCTMNSAWFQRMSAKSSGILFAKNYQTASDSLDQKGMLHLRNPGSLEKSEQY